MEVHSSGAPESILHSSLPGNNAPEVYSSNAPEVLHGPQDFPLEIAPGGGLEANHEGLEHAIASKEDAPIETKPRFSKAIKLWAGLAIGIIIIAAIIAGAVGGTVGNRKSSHSDLTNTPSSTSTIIPSITPNSSTGTQDLTPIIVNNTSIAAASCPNGDRWVFLQDIQGNVRGCQYSVSSSTWSVLPNTTIPTTAKLGSALGASCEDVSASLSSPNLYSGRYISVLYLNASHDVISQTTFANGAWRDSGLIQAAGVPANDTRLSVSTNIVPSLTIVNTTKTSPAYLSSVVTYQLKNASFVMMNTDPDTQHVVFEEDNPVNPNLFDLLQSDDGVEITPGDTMTGVGFSCIYNSLHPSVNRGIEPAPSPSQLYAQCFIAEGTSYESNNIEGTNWTYNQSSTGNGNYTVASPGYESFYPPNFDRTVDIVSFAFSQDNMALVYLNSNNTIAMDIGDVDTGLSSVDAPPLPATVPFRHIGATSGGNSSVIYVYYQVNETHLGEISFDNDNGVWSAQPVFVPVS
ncbi:MAG: hypothetical protein ASARMPREDX12_005172 [Alectoria sarmentosa]|nr:MAG: hypothetical protein ASARMPREDX12_005172 [Alectoria sarmentosa]